MKARKPPPPKSRRKKSSPRVSRRDRRSRWSAVEIRQLKKLYPSNSNRSIARALGRTLGSVAAQAFHLNLKKGPRRLREMGRENIARRWGGSRKSRR